MHRIMKSKGQALFKQSQLLKEDLGDYYELFKNRIEIVKNVRDNITIGIFFVIKKA
jgi:hypothetical protein